LFALIHRLVSLSGILPDGQSFQNGYDSRWDTYTLYWREPIDGSAGMALVTQVMSLSKASYHYGLTMYLVQHVAKSYTELLRLLSDFQKEFRLTL
jgi:20S proteasome alpha/beta subunit